MDDREKTEKTYDEGYEKGINDAWKCAKEIVLNPKEGGLNVIDLLKIFGTIYPYCILSKYSALEAMAKIKAWKMDKESD